MKKVLLCIIVLFGSFLVNVTPATATHDFDHGRWNRAPSVAWDGNYAGNIQDGAYYWEDRHFDGYLGPNLPAYNHGGTQCTTIWDGWINTCTVPRNVVEAYCGGPCNGHTSVLFDYPNRIIGSYTLIADDLYPGLRQATWRHEMGHAVGLGHVGWWETNCVMHTNANVLGETCKHDWDAMYLMYPGDRW